MLGINQYDVGNVYNLLLGSLGSILVNNSGKFEGEFVAFKAIHNDAVISLAEANLGDNLANITLLKGKVIVGTFRSITLTSGHIRAYQGNLDTVIPSLGGAFLITEDGSQLITEHGELLVVED